MGFGFQPCIICGPEVERLSEDLARVVQSRDEYEAERDEARAEVERLRHVEACHPARVEAQRDALVAAAERARYFLSGLECGVSPARHPRCPCRLCFAERGLDDALAKANGGG